MLPLLALQLQLRLFVPPLQRRPRKNTPLLLLLPSEAVVVWMVLMLTPLTLLAALPFWVWPTLEQWPYLAAMGLAGTLGHLCITRGFKAADASLAMTFEYARMPMSAAVGIVIFSEKPTVWTFLGAGIVALASAYIAHRETTLARQDKIDTEPDRKVVRL